MRNKLIFLFLSFIPCLTVYSQRYLFSGEDCVKAGEVYEYRPDFGVMPSYGSEVVFTVQNGKFVANGKTTYKNNIGSISSLLVTWDNIQGSGTLKYSAGSSQGYINVNIYSVKDATIKDIYYNGGWLSSDVIEIPKSESGSFVCRIGETKYPNAPYYGDFRINSFKWVLPKSFGGKTINTGDELRIDYPQNSGDGEVLAITPVGYNNYMGKTKSITIRRTGSVSPPTPPPFDGNIKNVTITSNKTYEFSSLYAENVTIKSGANVIMNGYNSVRIVPGFIAELGSIVRIYNGVLTRGSLDTDDDINNIDMINEKVQMNQNVPNPAKFYTIVESFIPKSTQNAYILIYNTLGEVVMKIPIRSTGQISIEINTHELSNGIYMYSLIVDDTLIDTKRMIVSN